MHGRETVFGNTVKTAHLISGEAENSQLHREGGGGGGREGQQHGTTTKKSMHYLEFHG